MEEICAMYTKSDVLDYVEMEDVKFIRLAFCDVFGKQRNISVLSSELGRAFDTGISIDASAIRGFTDEAHSDLLLHPDPSTLTVIPWRPTHCRVARMFCDITYPDGTPYEKDSRHILRTAEKAAEKLGINCLFSSEFEFYLFKTDEYGNTTDIPFDNAGYMDIAPEDRGENVRREICLNLESMGIRPESSHHEEGPGQNEIDFRFASPLAAADNAVTFRSVVKTAALRNGVTASFMPKPIKDKPGSGMHINISVKGTEEKAEEYFMAGVMKHIREITAFLNPMKSSYDRFGEHKAPKYVSWSRENRSQLIRIPAADGEYRRFELRSPDPSANVYLAYALLLYSGIDGIRSRIALPEPCDMNLFSAPESVTDKLERLPQSLDEAVKLALDSGFVSGIIPKSITECIAENE